VTKNEAISIQFWYKGTFNDNQKIINFRQKFVNVDYLYLIRYGDTLTAESAFTGPDLEFIDIMQPLSSTEWVFIGLSLGWTAFDDHYTIWAYIYQSTTGVEESGWTTKITISEHSISRFAFYKYEFGPGWDGYLKSFYITNTLHDYFAFTQFKNTFGQPRLNCFETDFNEDPFYINPGWGNGYVLTSESTEECDDKGLASGDGWSNTWTIESPYSWANVGVAGISSCSISWGNGKVK